MGLEKFSTPQYWNNGVMLSMFHNQCTKDARSMHWATRKTRRNEHSKQQHVFISFGIVLQQTNGVISALEVQQILVQLLGICFVQFRYHDGHSCKRNF
jgi:hypothetical protein